MPRLNIDRQKELEPERMDYAIYQLDAAGMKPLIISENRIEFEFKGESVILFPSSGWHSGKSIKDGRGIKKLLNQLK